MDLSFPYLLHLIILCVSVSLIFLIYRHKSSSPTNLPPGKTGWPVIGETWDFIRSGRTGKPEKFVTDRMNRYSSNVFKTSLYGEKMAVLCGAAGNKFLFSNENKLVTFWWPKTLKEVLFFPTLVKNSSKKESTTKKRNFLPEFLKPEALQNYVPIMDSMARQQIKEEWAPNTEVKACPLSKKYSFSLACKLFMSINDPNRVAKIAEPFPLVTAGILSVPINLPGAAFNLAIKGAKIIREELVAIIKQKKMEVLEKREVREIDLLTRLLLDRDEDGKFMNEREISNNIIGLLFAGHGTSTAIIFVVKNLAESPQVYSKVLEEQMEIAKSKGPDELLNWDDIQKMKYSWCVANEAMRLAPPAHGAFREAKTDFTYAGFSIPKGWKTYWTAYSTHKNPKYFPNPEKFDPSRFEGKGPAPYTFVPFGGGPRLCPGKEYARLEILIFMHNLVTKFKWEKVIPNEQITYNPEPIPVNGLPIRLQPHCKLNPV